MKIIVSALLYCLLCIGVTCAAEDTVMQVSTIDALLAGVYDGEVTLGELKKQGDFGIGTFDKLDGELLMLDNVIYQIRVDGNVYVPSDDVTTPFASVCTFAPEKNVVVPTALDLDGLYAFLDAAAPNENAFYAIKLEGTFRYMKTRSVPSQDKPYPPLAEVAKGQSVFEMQHIEGTIVGFRCPPYVEGINVPGYHLHFICNDKSQGGHVLELTIEEATAEIDGCNKFYLELPEDVEGFASVDLSQDRREELARVEK